MAHAQRTRAAALRELADAYIAEADASGRADVRSYLREYAAFAINRARGADADAEMYEAEADNAITRAKTAELRARSRR